MDGKLHRESGARRLTAKTGAGPGSEVTATVSS